jgi:hypothetical protein
MYSRCIRCHRSLGTNSEIAHLAVGRRIAFDTEKGRLWAICTHCDQWNLAPIEERWEALEECARVADSAEAKSGRNGIGVARTATGLELLRVGELSAVDIANSRYGRRIAKRLRTLLGIAICLAIIVIELGIRAGMDTRSVLTGFYVVAAAGALAAAFFSNPPRILPTSFAIGGKRRRLWPWEFSAIKIELSQDSGRPCIRTDAEHCLEGRAAVQLLGAILPVLNGGDCAIASVRIALARVNDAERRTRTHTTSVERKHRDDPDSPHLPRVLRPWERIAESIVGFHLIGLGPDARLALEMAVTEESELLELDADATGAAAAWPDQEQIASIADRLIVDENVETLLRNAQTRLEPKKEP